MKTRPAGRPRRLAAHGFAIILTPDAPDGERRRSVMATIHKLGLDMWSLCSYSEFLL